MKRGQKEEAKRRHALFRRGEFDHALASIDKSIQQSPNDDLLYRERAHLYLYRGETQKARADFEVAALEKPVSFDASSRPIVGKHRS